jgi:hypothetical protein
MMWVLNLFGPSYTRGLLIIFLFLMLGSLRAQTPPEWVYSQGSGSWSASGLWNTEPDGSGEWIPNPGDPATSVVVQGGHHITLPGARQVFNLEVQPGGSLASGLALNRYVEVYGNSILINGLAGGPGDGLCFDVNGPQCVLSGSGDIQLSRLRKDNDSGASPSTELLIEGCEVYLSWSASASLYNNGSAGAGTQRSFHVTLAADAALYAAGDVSIDGVTGNTVAWNDGSLTVYGHLDVAGNLMLRSGNPAGGNIDYHLYGSARLGGIVLGAQAVSVGAAVATLHLHSGSELELQAPGVVFSQLSGTRDAILTHTGSELIYDHAQLQVVEGSFGYSQLVLRGGHKQLGSSAQVSEQLQLDGGLFTLGAHDLHLWAGAVLLGGGPGSYVQTNSTGRLWQELSAPTLFPVGNSSYNPALLSRSSGSGSHGVRVFDLVLSEGLSGVPLFEQVVQRTWDVSGFLGSAELELQVQWNQAEERPGFFREACYLSQHLNGAWESTPPEAASGSDPYTFARSGIQGLPSAFAMASQGALPVALLNFRVAREGDGARLRWATAWERYHAYFAVERSSDGKQFHPLGHVAHRSPKEQGQEYSWLDAEPLEGWNYYRLRQVDYDGSYEYSPVESLYFENRQAALVLYPNPAQDWVEVQYRVSGNRVESLRLYNRLGIEIGRWPMSPGETSVRVSLGHLPAGVYYLLAGQQRQVLVLGG